MEAITAQNSVIISTTGTMEWREWTQSGHQAFAMIKLVKKLYSFIL